MTCIRRVPGRFSPVPHGRRVVGGAVNARSELGVLQTRWRAECVAVVADRNEDFSCGVRTQPTALTQARRAYGFGEAEEIVRLISVVHVIGEIRARCIRFLHNRHGSSQQRHFD